MHRFHLFFKFLTAHIFSTKITATQVSKTNFDAFFPMETYKKVSNLNHQRLRKMHAAIHIMYSYCGRPPKVPMPCTLSFWSFYMWLLKISWVWFYFVASLYGDIIIIFYYPLPNNSTYPNKRAPWLNHELHFNVHPEINMHPGKMEKSLHSVHPVINVHPVCIRKGVIFYYISMWPLHTMWQLFIP